MQNGFSGSTAQQKETLRPNPTVLEDSSQKELKCKKAEKWLFCCSEFYWRAFCYPSPQGPLSKEAGVFMSGISREEHKLQRDTR